VIAGRLAAPAGAGRCPALSAIIRERQRRDLKTPVVGRSICGARMMTTETILIAIFAVLCLILLMTGIATAFLISSMRALRAEQQAVRRALANMDWTTVLGHMQNSSKESVRILDIIDKRLQKLEALEKLQISQAEMKQGR
jgi:uncharacterized protein (DUF58 family)